MKIQAAGLGMAHMVLGTLDATEDNSTMFLRLRVRLPEVVMTALEAKNVRPALFGRLNDMVQMERPKGWLRSLWCMVRCAVQNDEVGVRFHAGRVLHQTMASSYLGNLPNIVAADPSNAEAASALVQAEAALSSFVNEKLGAAL